MEKQILDLIKKPLNEIDLTVLSVVFKKKANNNFLEIKLDKDSIFSVEDIVDATNIIEPLLDEIDIIKDEYILDVSSKGID